MNEQIRNEIEKIEESTKRLQALAQDNPAILKNADILLTFVYILKFITPSLTWPEPNGFIGLKNSKSEYRNPNKSEIQMFK